MTTPAALRELADFEAWARKEFCRRPSSDFDRNDGTPPNRLGLEWEYNGDALQVAWAAWMERSQLRTAASEGVSVHRLPPPDAVEYPDSGFRTDADALAIWAAHRYDTGGTPYWGADAMHSLAARAKAEAHPPEVARDAEYEFEIWQGGAWQAGGSCASAHEAGAEAAHYEMMYGQDGPVEVRYYVKYRIDDVAISGAAGVG